MLGQLVSRPRVGGNPKVIGHLRRLNVLPLVEVDHPRSEGFDRLFGAVYVSLT